MLEGQNLSFTSTVNKSDSPKMNPVNSAHSKELRSDKVCINIYLFFSSWDVNMVIIKQVIKMEIKLITNDSKLVRISLGTKHSTGKKLLFPREEKYLMMGGLDENLHIKSLHQLDYSLQHYCKNIYLTRISIRPAQRHLISYIFWFISTDKLVGTNEISWLMIPSLH